MFNLLEKQNYNYMSKKKESHEIVKKSDYSSSLFQEFDNYFNKLWKKIDDYFWKPYSSGKPFSLKIREDPFFRMPSTNFKENETSYLISAELPGLDKGDIEITIKKGALEIKGKLNEKTKEQKGDTIRKEYRSSSYYRSFSLPKNVNENEIDAKMENGILKIKIPKTKQNKSEKKRIELK